MSSSPSPASPHGAATPDAPAPATQTAGGCAHCDTSVPHRHVDVETAVSEAQTALRGHALVALVVLVLAVVDVGALGHRVPGYAADPPLGLPFTAIGLGLWAAATVVGVLLARRSTEHAAMRGLVVGAAVMAAVAPVAGLLAALAGGGSPWLALLAAAGWLVGSALAFVVSQLRLGRMLREEGEAGEALRQAAVHGHISRRPALGWLWHPLGVAVWGALAAALPLTLIVTVPLHVALTLAIAVRGRRAAD